MKVWSTRGTPVRGSLEFERLFLGAYGLAHYGKSLIWYSSELLFAFFLTETCGLPSRLMGHALALSLVVSGLADLLVGRVLGPRVRSVTTAASFQLAGAVATGATLLLFSVTGFMLPVVRFSFALLTGLTFRVAYALYDTPQNAMLSLASTEERSRTRLSSIRFVFSGLATLSIAAVAVPLLNGDAKNHTANFTLFSGGLLAMGIVSSVLVLAISRSRRELGRESEPAPPDFCTDEKAFAAGGLTLILAIGFVVSAATLVFTKLEPYFVAYVLQSQFARGSVMISIAVGGIAGQPLWAWLATRWSLPPAFRISALVMTLGATAFLGLGGQGVGAAALAGFVYGVGSNGLGMLIWVALANFAAPHGSGGRAHSTTMVFGLFTFVLKSGSAVAVEFVAEVLAGIDTAAATSWSLVGPMGVMPLLGGLICLFAASYLPDARESGSAA
ncbi:MAG: MFS transporter [Pseudomonadota bacterium]|nr:MFS transporter [Pseudomonadota bacterium]